MEAASTMDGLEVRDLTVTFPAGGGNGKALAAEQEYQHLGAEKDEHGQGRKRAAPQEPDAGRLAHVEHHDHEQEQNHYGADVNENLDGGQEGGTEKDEERGHLD